MSTTPTLLAPGLSQALGIKNKIYLKREDLHPFGSHKGRSIPVMIDHQIQSGIRDFVVSSSGNAALAAALYIKKCNQKNKKQPLTLQILVGEKIPAEKLKPLKKLISKNIALHQLRNPRQTAFQLEKEKNIHWLRQSTDDTALVGYETLTKELAKIKNLKAIFIPTSSGTTAVGLYQGFKKLKLKPQIHIVQTTACHPFVKTDKPDTKESLANAIVDVIGHRKNEIEKILKANKGAGWVADDDEITAAIKLFKKNTKLKISPNSALSLVGLKQATEKNKKIKGTIALMITGK